MRPVTEKIYIFSAFNSTRTEEDNLSAHKKLLQLLRDKGYTAATVEGKYEGKEETSIILLGTNLTESVVSEISAGQLQESYLVVHYDGVSELVFNTGHRKILGEMKEVTEDQAKRKPAYTKVGKQFFIVE